MVSLLAIFVGIVIAIVAIQFLHFFFFHTKKKCPFWLGYLIDNPIRQWLTKQPRALARFVKTGMLVADVGCGHGTNTLTLATLVGPEGLVYAIDIEPKMLEKTQKRCQSRGLDTRIKFIPCTAVDPGLPTGTLDFVLLSAVLHEVPDCGLMLQSVFDSLKPGGKFLLAEPPVHVGARKLALEASLACEIGFRHTAEVPMGFLNALSFEKPK